MNKVRTIFIGTGEFAIPLLEAAMQHELLELVAVVTQPDKLSGRKQELTPGPLKKSLLEKDIKVSLEQPENIRESSQELLNKYNPELILVASYGQIIPNSIFEYPKYKALNFHGSLLPKLRGAVPVQMAILHGLEETGVTLQIMAEKMDVGDIISMRSYKLSGNETTESLMQELAKLAVDILENDLEKWITGKLKGIPQNESEASYCYRDDISKEKAELTFETDVELAERMLRAFYPWPIAWLKLEDGKMLKIFKARAEDRSQHNQGLQIKRSGTKLLLELKNGTLELLEVQLEGKKRDKAKNYLYLAD